MAGHSRTKRQREEQLVQIAKMHFAKVTQQAIADRLGLSQQQICHDLKEIYRRWREPTKESLTFWKERMLSKIENHEDVARELLDYSLKPKERNEASLRSEPGGVQGESDAAHLGRDKEVVSKKQVTEGQSGNPAYLKSIEWCMEQEIKIRGLNAPQVLDLESRKPLQFIRVIPVKRDEHEPPVDPATGAPAGTYVPDAFPGGGAAAPAPTGNSGAAGPRRRPSFTVLPSPETRPGCDWTDGPNG